MLATTALIFACSLNLDQIYMIQNALFILKGAVLMGLFSVIS